MHLIAVGLGLDVQRVEDTYFDNYQGEFKFQRDLIVMIDAEELVFQIS